MTKQSQSVALSERVNAKTHAFKLVLARQKLGIILQIIGTVIIVTSWTHPLFWDHKDVNDGIIVGLTWMIAGVGVWFWHEGEKRRC